VKTRLLIVAPVLGALAVAGAVLLMQPSQAGRPRPLVLNPASPAVPGASSAARGASSAAGGRSPIIPVPPRASGPVHAPGGCAAVPHACGFPDATSTGVPRNLPLRTVPGQVSSGPGWRYDPRGWVEVYGDGALLKGLSIPCTVNVAAANVTITDDRIMVKGNLFGISLRHAHNVTIEYSDIYSPSAGRGRLMVGVKDIFGDSTGTRVIGDNIWHTGTGVQLESGLVEGNYIHAAGYRPGDHVNGITSNGGKPGTLVIKHNTILIDRDQTDAIGLFEDFGRQANRYIVDNLLAGGGYTIYGGQNKGGLPTYNIHIRGNSISRIFYPEGGYYGQIAAFSPGGRGNTWSGNAWSGDAAGRAAGTIPLP
jgi:hypothetical protein